MARKKIETIIKEKIAPYTLTDKGMADISQLVRQYSYELLLECIDIGVSTYFRYDENGKLTQDSASNFLNKLGGIGLYEKLYEDNAEGKVTDEWFMQLSHKYEVERMELKAKIAEYKERLRQLAENNRNKENFISAVRKFMEMKELTPALLHELIDRIEVYETEGTDKNRTQRIMIYYRFVGYIEISGGDRKRNHTAETRKGVAVQYLTA